MSWRLSLGSLHKNFDKIIYPRLLQGFVVACPQVVGIAEKIFWDPDRSCGKQNVET